MVQFILEVDEVKLFKGDTNDEFHGLVRLLGQGNVNHVMCEKGLGFLNKLFSPEFCTSSLYYN